LKIPDDPSKSSGDQCGGCDPQVENHWSSLKTLK